MAAFLGNTEIGFKKTGTVVTVANDPKAKLMYYLSCITTVLEVCSYFFLSLYLYVLVLHEHQGPVV